MAVQSLKVYFKADTKEAWCLPAANAVPTGATLIGTIDHDGPDDPVDAFATNHVEYHHIREALNLLGKPATDGKGWDWDKAVTNMQEIKMYTEFAAPRSVSQDSPEDDPALHS